MRIAQVPFPWSFLLFPLLVGLMGCSSSPVTAWSIWPFDPPENSSYETPPERLEKLEALGQDASVRTPPEQAEICANLAMQIRNEPDPLIREHIIRTIGQYSAPTASAVVHAGLKDENPDVRAACCEVLARRGESESVAALAEALHSDEDIDVRLAATRGLAEFRQQDAISALAVALEDPDPALQYRAVQSLRSMTDLDYGNDVNRWLEYVRGGRPAPPPAPSIADRVQRLFR